MSSPSKILPVVASEWLGDGDGALPAVLLPLTGAMSGLAGGGWGLLAARGTAADPAPGVEVGMELRVGVNGVNSRAPLGIPEDSCKALE